MSSTKNNINTNFSASYLTLQSESFKISVESGSLKFFDPLNPSGKALSVLSTIYADVSASYIVLNSTSSLPNERVLTAGAGISITDSGPGGTATVSIDNSVISIISSSYIPNMLIWEDPGAGSPVYQTSNILRISDKLYAFGGLLTGSGTATNKIYSASYIENPVFVETGATLPDTPVGGRACIVDDKIWMFGWMYTTYGASTGSLILTASVSDPLNWGSTGVNLPERRNSAPLILTPTKAIIIKGFNQLAGVNRSTLLTASLTNLTDWGITPTGYGNADTEVAGAVVDSIIHFFGGSSFPTSLLKGSANSNPITMPVTNIVPMDTILKDPAVFHNGDDIFVFGGNNNLHMFSAKVGGMSLWLQHSSVLANTTQYISGNSWVGPDGRFYYIRYGASFDAKILRSSRSSVNVFMNSFSGSSDPYAGLSGINSDGSPAFLGKYVRLGFRPWLYSRTGTI